MYHERFRGNHYEIGFKWGTRLFKCGKLLLDNVPFSISQERLVFAKQCRPFYKEWYPEILEEIRGIAEGQKVEPEKLEAVLFSLYCIMPENKCSCFAFRDGGHIVLARNSDFLPEFNRLSMNCIYKFGNGGNAFQGNTTAYVEMEDGMNEHGLAIGLTSVFPKKLEYGLNAGMLLRYGLEKCMSVNDFVEVLRKVPIASSQTFTAVDPAGTAAVIECNAEKMEVCYTGEGQKFVSGVNAFYQEAMKKYRMKGMDDWNSGERYETIRSAFCQGGMKDAVSFAMDVLSGKYGFMCQYDRKTGKDTVWSVIYDVGSKKIYRCEGNPSRKRYAEDNRPSFLFGRSNSGECE